MIAEKGQAGWLPLISPVFCVSGPECITLMFINSSSSVDGIIWGSHLQLKFSINNSCFSHSFKLLLLQYCCHSLDKGITICIISNLCCSQTLVAG